MLCVESAFINLLRTVSKDIKYLSVSRFPLPLGRHGDIMRSLGPWIGPVVTGGSSWETSAEAWHASGVSGKLGLRMLRSSGLVIT